MTTIHEAMAAGINAHQTGQIDTARTIYRAICDQAPDHPVTANAMSNLASILERENQLDEARRLAELAIAIEPAQQMATLILARCHRRSGDMRAALKQIECVHSEDWNTALFYEYARILDRLGRHQSAIEAFGQANATMARSMPPTRRDLLPTFLSTVRALFSPQWLDSWTPTPPGSRPDPVFMVGFNRSGTTLLHVMLEAHPDVRVIEETHAIDQARDALKGRDTHGLNDLSTLEISAAREAYFKVADAHAPDARGRTLVDKLPLNTISLGLIHRLFPRAKVIFSLRHPADVVLSNFMQPYKPNPITCHFETLQSTAKMYSMVMDLGMHLREVLPLNIIDVRYEDLVEDWEGEVRRLLDFTGLSWDEAIGEYLSKTQSKGRIGTPSYDQVIEPVNRRSLHRWRNHTDALQPVMPCLQRFIQAFGYGSTSEPI